MSCIGWLPHRSRPRQPRKRVSIEHDHSRSPYSVCASAGAVVRCGALRWGVGEGVADSEEERGEDLEGDEVSDGGLVRLGSGGAVGVGELPGLRVDEHVDHVDQDDADDQHLHRRARDEGPAPLRGARPLNRPCGAGGRSQQGRPRLGGQGREEGAGAHPSS